MKLTPTNRRTIKVGDLSVIAVRPGKVCIGATWYSTVAARRIAREAAEPLRAKVLEQADWADGKDL